MGVTDQDGADYTIQYGSAVGLFGTNWQTYLYDSRGQLLAELTAMSGKNNVKDACGLIARRERAAS